MTTETFNIAVYQRLSAHIKPFRRKAVHFVCYQETQLIEFFSSLPKPQPREELEFFGAPFFSVSVSGLRINFSASTHYKDVRIDLFQDLHPFPKIAAYVVHDVSELKFFKDSSRRPWLSAENSSGDLLKLAVEPHVTVIFEGAHKTDQS